MRVIFAAMALLCAAAPALSQDSHLEIPDDAIDELAPLPPDISTVTVPRLTEVVLAVMADLSSNETRKGETFPIRLLQPITVNGVEVVPADAEGLGEVVHAKGSGGMGAAGELLLTARYIEHNGQRIPLRSFRMGAEANSRIDTVNRLNVASAVALPVVALAGFFIEGDALRVASGTPALARLAEDTVIALPADEEVGALVDMGDEAESSESAVDFQQGGND